MTDGEREDLIAAGVSPEHYFPAVVTGAVLGMCGMIVIAAIAAKLIAFAFS